MTMLEMENKIREIIREGKPLHGWAREIAIEMALREMEAAEKAKT